MILCKYDINLRYQSFKEMLTKHLLIGFVVADIS